MNLNRPICLIILFWIGFNFSNCCRCPPVDEFFDINDMSISYVLIDDKTSTMIVDTTLEFNKLSHFRIDFDVDYISSIHDCLWNEFSTMNSAYGCDCLVNGDSGSKEESIDSVSIKTIFDYDENHNMNTLINHVFAISPRLRTDEWRDLNLHISNNMDVLIRHEFILLKLIEKPISSTTFQFEISIDLSTGEKHTTMSPTFEFL